MVRILSFTLTRRISHANSRATFRRPRISPSPLESMKETGSFTSIERLCDDAVMKYVKDAKYISFGIEPLIAYTAAKQAEIKSVRIVLAGKAAGLAPNLIRERLRETYG